MMSAKGTSASGRLTAINPLPVRWSIRHGMPKPTAAISPSVCGARLLHGLHRNIEQSALIEPGDCPLCAVVHRQPFIHRSSEELGSAHVDANGASRRHIVTICGCRTCPMIPANRLNRRSARTAPTVEGVAAAAARAEAEAPAERQRQRAAAGAAAPRAAGAVRPAFLRSPIHDLSSPAPRAGSTAARRGGRDGSFPGRGDRPSGEGGGQGRRRRARRILKYVLIAIVAWLLLSLVLFMSAPRRSRATCRAPPAQPSTPVATC